MPVSDGYREFIIEQLSEIEPVTWRRMFGAVGIYARGLFFAIISDDTLYFKVDAQSQPGYEVTGQQPFRPMGDAKPMRYYSVPIGVIEDVDRLREWMGTAVAVAGRAKHK
jgi:DNA transformation protein